MEREKQYINDDNFIIDGELTVKITLNEYRRLVEFKGAYKDKVGNLESELWKLRGENQTLREKITSLMCGNVDKEADE